MMGAKPSKRSSMKKVRYLFFKLIFKKDVDVVCRLLFFESCSLVRLIYKIIIHAYLALGIKYVR